MATTDVIGNGANVSGSQGGGGAFVDGLRTFGVELGQSLPDILGALAVIILGIILANILRNIVRRLVIWSRIDDMVQKNAPQVGGMDQGGANIRVADIAGGLVKWAVILLAIGIAANVLEWTQVTMLMDSIVAYLPNIAAAVLLLIGGYLLGGFVGSLVSGMGDSFGARTAEVMGNVVRWAILVFAVMAALIQLGIAESIIQIAFVGLVAMLSLAGGLAFGLGGRDKARELLSDIRPQRTMAM